MVTPEDERFMERALVLASRGRGRTSPNPMVGALVVSPDGVVLGHGFHERAGEPHAEVHALNMAGDRARGATLYSTLEPCSHQGRTGPCVDRIVEAGVKRVVAAVEDPNPLVSGRGLAYLREHGVDVEVGPGRDASIRLNQPFFTLMREGRPFVVLKAATSLDGYIAAAAGQRTALTSADADRHAHRVRAEIDAIGVGVNTVIVDDPLLTARGAYRERPLVRVIFDRRLRTPAGARVLSTGEAGPVIIVTTPAAAARRELRQPLEDRGAVLEVVESAGLGGALGALGARGIGSLLLEGGTIIHRAAWDGDLVDYVRLYVTPHIIGPGGVPFLGDSAFSSAALLERHIEPLGPDTVIEGYVHGPR